MDRNGERGRKLAGGQKTQSVSDAGSQGEVRALGENLTDRLSMGMQFQGGVSLRRLLNGCRSRTHEDREVHQGR